MEDERKVELEILTKCIEDLEAFKKDAVDCDSVMSQEYHEINDILEKMITRRIPLELEIRGISYEEL